MTIKYPYPDENGHVLYTKVRMQDSSGKQFLYEREDNGNIIMGMGDRKVLYYLPHVLTGIKHNQTIFLVEGEKDADTLLGKTIIATTSPITTLWQDEWTKLLQEADVVILYDYDKAGVKRRDMLSQKLHGNVKRLRVVELPGLEYRENHGLDITDWFEMGHSIEEFKILLEQTPDYRPVENDTIKVISLEELLTLEVPPREMILAPFLTGQGLVMIYAKRGIGKTHIALGIAHAVASGGTFLKWSAPTPKKVLFIDGEMPLTALQERVNKISIGSSQRPAPNFLQFITPDLQNNCIPDLSTKEGQEEIEKYALEADLIIVDNISSLFRSSVENESQSWQPIQEWALYLRRKGKAVLFIHHAGKNGQQRGTSKREDLLDAIITLKHPENYQPEQGACFEVHFEKTRHFYGQDAAGFKVKLSEAADGSWAWEMSATDVDDGLVEIADLMDQGMTIEEMVKATGLTKSQVETKRTKARSLGLVKK